MTTPVQYTDVARLSNSIVVAFIERINTLFSANYRVQSAQGCKWPNAKSLARALNENHYAEHYDSISADNISAFISQLDEAGRTINTITTEVKEAQQNNSHDLYQQAMKQIVEAFPLLR